MSLWGSTDQANNKPKYANTANVYGVDAAESGVAGGDVPHTGWVEVKKGAGTVVSVTINDGGTGYANGELVEFSAGDAVAVIATDASGVITAVTVTDGGTPLLATPTATPNTVGGSTADLTAVLGGRFGRTQFEVLVAGGITGDAEDSEFPDA